MITIGENVHIISKNVREALEKKDENFIKNLIKIQQNLDCIDLNVGPAKGKLDKVFEWLIPLAGDKNISLDSTNITAIKNGFELIKEPKNCFINSTSKDEERLEPLTDLAQEKGCNLVALAMSKQTGIPKTSDERLELVFEIYEKCQEKGISDDKIFFDPLIIPVKAEQTQAIEAINTIRMIKESLPDVRTIVGLSNVSNGMPSNIRPLINRVYAVMAYGAGLDAVILDAKDSELLRILEMLKNNSPSDVIDNLYIKLANIVQNFGEIEDVEFDKNSVIEQNIYKAALVLSNKNIYSDSFTQV